MVLARAMQRLHCVLPGLTLLTHCLAVANMGEAAGIATDHGGDGHRYWRVPTGSR